MAVIAAFSSCDRQVVEPDPFEGLYAVNTVEIADLGLEMTVYADDTLFTGYNHLYFAFRNQEQAIVQSGLEVTVTPLMHMPAMTHSAPVEQPVGPNGDGAHECAVYFIMATTADSYWELAVQVRDMDQDRTHSVTVPVEARERQETRIRNFITADDSSKLFLSLVSPLKPKVGMNDFEVCVHRKASMMDFPAVEDLTIEIEPTMPSMGHGSPNNEHPVHQQNGHYRGKVNFTMDGWWQVAVTVKRQEQVIARTELNMTFMAQ